MRRFQDKTVIITEAGSALGRAAAIRFAKEGASMVLVGQTAASLEETATLLPQDHTWIHADNHLTITCDITQPNQVSAMVEHALKKFEHIDVLVNIAALTHLTKANEVKTTERQNALENDLSHTQSICQTLIPALCQSKGNIVNVFSLSDHQDTGRVATYELAKTGLSDLTHHLAIALGPKRVRINAISSTIAADSTSPDYQASQSLLGLEATPNDIAAAITFLASEDAAMITGATLPVDGGVNLNDSQSAS